MSFQPRTSLEKELFSALGRNEEVLNPNKELTNAEEKALKVMSVKDVRHILPFHDKSNEFVRWPVQMSFRSPISHLKCLCISMLTLLVVKIA